MSVHYRFKSALEYDTITFDGLHISVKELKNSIIQQKRIGKSTDFDLNITNAQTQEVYEDENALIPKNTSLLVARVPLIKPRQKPWEGYGGDDTPPINNEDVGPIGKTLDLATLDAPEDDKIKAMMSQSTQEYDPSNYVKIRGANQVGPVPTNYRCYKCHQNGHWIKDCPLGQNNENVEIKKSTGIPYSFMVPVEGPQVPGALLLATGQYAVPALDMQAYNQKNPVSAPVQETKPEIPEDLLCSICSDLLTDAVMIPCCGNSFCDECIRSMLLDSEEHECPDCHEKEIAPTTLIPNRFLRKSVANFKNTTGYEKKTTKLLLEKEPNVESSNDILTPSLTADSTNKRDNVASQRQTVISEADSTEQSKAISEPSKSTEPVSEKTNESEGPPGVSPKQSPRHHQPPPSKVNNDRSERDMNYDRSKHLTYRSDSPRKSARRRSHSYEPISDDKQGSTPTRDEPSGISYSVTSNDTYHSVAPITGTVTSIAGSTGILGGAAGHNLHQGPPSSTLPPGVYAPTQQQQPPHMAGFPPPIHGPPPNFRMPPPGTQPPPQYLGPNSYGVGARQMFDPTRPPISAPPSGFNQNFPPRSRQDYNVRRGLADRPPASGIDDPLTAFNRILRELDEKRARQRFARRSWSRSRSRSRSYSRSPPPLRRRSRTPRRRKSRSRSRSFFLSRSRSRSYTKSPRGSPLPMRRSPPPLQMRRGHSRYRSPLRSPPIRYPPPMRDYHSSHIPNIPIQRKYDDYGPPGIDQPPIPGLESELPPVGSKFIKKSPSDHIRDRHRDRYVSPRDDDRDKKERMIKRREEKRSRSRSITPDRWRNPSPRLHKDLSPDRIRKKHVPLIEYRDERRREKERHRDYSDEEKRRKSKDKKRHKDKKDEKRKKRDKKDKHKKSEKEKKDKKEEQKHVALSNDNTASNVKAKADVLTSVESNQENHEEKMLQEKSEIKLQEQKETEQKRQAEEQKKEERRLRFLEDEKKKREEETINNELKRKAIDEARRVLEEEQQQQQQIVEQKRKTDLYDEIISEKEANVEIKESFNSAEENPATNDSEQKNASDNEATKITNPNSKPNPPLLKDADEEDLGILELHSDMDIKLDESDMVAQMPEKSKWEVDEDVGQTQPSPKDLFEPIEMKSEMKVSSEVLKRAENVIFARAINSIRPIEIKKISGDRAKLYADEKKDMSAEEFKKPDQSTVERPRIPIKERLGVKVDDSDPKHIVMENRKSRSLSPFSRRERRIEIEDYRKPDRKHSRSRRLDYIREDDRNKERERRKISMESSIRKTKHDTKEKEKRDERKEKRKRSPSSDHDDRRKKRKEKKTKKDKERTSKKNEDETKTKISDTKLKSATEKRKVTLDESNFVPDYDLDIHEQEPGDNRKTIVRKDAGGDQSSSGDSSTSSEGDKKKRKRKKHRKKKKKVVTSSSSSDSSSDSSDSEKERKRKRHKKNKKKKKKSKQT